MIVQALKRCWDAFIGPFRPRTPIQDWKQDLLKPEEKQRIVSTNRRIRQNVAQFKQELALIDRDHSQE